MLFRQKKSPGCTHGASEARPKNENTFVDWNTKHIHASQNCPTHQYFGSLLGMPIL
jgi:hypothetical protein